MLGNQANPILLDRDRPYVRLLNRSGFTFPYVFLSDLAPLLVTPLVTSAENGYFSAKAADVQLVGRLLQLVDDNGKEAGGAISLQKFRNSGESDRPPGIGPQEVRFRWYDQRFFHGKRFRATILCPANEGYRFYSKFVSNQLEHFLADVRDGEIPAQRVAPFFVLDDVFKRFDQLFRTVECSGQTREELLSKHLEAYLARQFTSLSIFGVTTNDQVLVETRLRGISERFLMAYSSVASALVSLSLKGNEFARHHMREAIAELFPPDSPSPRAAKAASEFPSQPVAKIPRPERKDIVDADKWAARERSDEISDASETVRLTVTAIQSAIGRRSIGADLNTAIQQLLCATPDEEATKREMLMIIQGTAPKDIEGLHQWCLGLLPKALALIAAQK